MATLILTAVGTAIGGPVGGALGALLGRAVDQAVILKPKGREGPRLADLQVQTSSYGSAIPRIFGTMRVAGTVIWATDLRETKHKSGGGKGRPSVTSYSYAASFAVALSSRAAVGIGRIWADGNLLRGAGGDFKTEVGAFRFHAGGNDQAVDPLIAAAQGTGQTPAHRGIAYAVFEDLALADFGNRIPSLTFELIADPAPVTADDLVSALTDGMARGDPETGIAGYAADGEDVRTALRPLADAHGWMLRADDVVRIDGGTAGDESVSAPMLAARVNGREEAPVREARAPSETVPVRLSLRHYEPARDYQAGMQRAVRPGAGRREVSVDLPVAMAADRARAMAQAQLARQWAGRRTAVIQCGWRALMLRPGTIVGVEGQRGGWRVEESEWERMGVRLTLRAVAQEGPMSLPASSGGGVHQPDVPHGPTSLMLADLPVLGDSGPSVPQLAVAAAGTHAGWRRAALFTRDPVSAAATPVGGTAPAAVMGQVTAVPSASTALLFDETGTVEVELLAEDMLLSPADDGALLAGANLCRVGRELLQFGTAVQTGPRAFRLGRLLRGRRGTEWAMGDHAIAAPFLLIEADRLASVPDEAVHVGSMLKVMAIGIGDAVPAEAETVVAGEALIPLSPVHVSRRPDGAGGWIVGWTRRSRAGWKWPDGVEAPLGEEQERYALRLMDGPALVRAAEVAVPGWTYGAAMQAEDALAGHAGPLTLEMRQIGTHAVGRPAAIVLG